MNAIIGAVILVVVIAIYVTVSYFYGKQKGDDIQGWNGNCAVFRLTCSTPAKKKEK